MHILMVSEYFAPHGMGGGELSALALAKSLIKQKVNVSVLTSFFTGDAKTDVIDGVQIYRRLSTGSNPDTITGNLARRKLTSSIEKELPLLIKEINPDVVQAMNITSMPGVAAIAKQTGIPAIAHINSPLAFCPKGTLLDHGREREAPYTFWSFVSSYLAADELGRLGNSWYLKYNPLAWISIYRRWVAIRNSFPMFSHFFPISTAMQSWLGKYGVAKEKTTVLYNLIPLDEFAHMKSTTNRIPLLLYIGGYAKFKGLGIILEALKDVQDLYLVHAYGKGAERVELEQQAKTQNVHVVFHGEFPNKDLPGMLAKSDVLLFPSQVPEGLGRVAIEAMAAGKPVIASDIGGMKDTVMNNVTGLLVEPSSVPAWTEAITTLLKDAKARARMGRAGKQRAFAVFTEKTIMTQAVIAYKKVLG